MEHVAQVRTVLVTALRPDAGGLEQTAYGCPAPFPAAKLPDAAQGSHFESCISAANTFGPKAVLLPACPCPTLQQLTSEAAGGKFEQIPLNGCALGAVQRSMPKVMAMQQEGVTNSRTGSKWSCRGQRTHLTPKRGSSCFKVSSG